MKATEIKTLQDAERFCEGLLNDFELGIADKAETMKQLAKYTKAILMLKGKCRECARLMLALPGNSNTHEYDYQLLESNRPDVEIFCESPLNPSIFWNERSGDEPEIILDFSCKNFSQKLIIK